MLACRIMFCHKLLCDEPQVMLSCCALEKWRIIFFREYTVGKVENKLVGCKEKGNMPRHVIVGHVFLQFSQLGTSI
jgi:hypothetical protein